MRLNNKTNLMFKQIAPMLIVFIYTISCTQPVPKNIKPSIEKPTYVEEILLTDSSCFTIKETTAFKQLEKVSLKKENNALIIDTLIPIDYYQQFVKKQQIFTLNINQDTLILCEEGTVIKVKAYSFIDEKTGALVEENIQFEVKEFYQISDILLANLSTVSNGELLETGGMLHFSASSNGRNCILKDGAEIEIEFPTKNKKNDMQLFTGNWTENQQMNWNLLPGLNELNQIVEFAEKRAEFPGGNKEMFKFINSNISYPTIDIERGIQGKVYVSFTINRFGEVKNARIVKGISPTCNQAVLDLILKFPKFEPAIQNGQAVNSVLTLPINFNISDGGTTFNTIAKNNFEKSYTDTTINTASESEISAYLFRTSNLGWINCDRFLRNTDKKINYLVDLESKSFSDVKIIFHDIKSIMSSSQNQKTHLFNNIPINKKITIVIIKQMNNKTYLAIKEAKTSEERASGFDFKEITMEKLKIEMEKLNKLS